MKLSGMQCAFNEYSGKGEPCTSPTSRYLQQAHSPGVEAPTSSESAHVAPLDEKSEIVVVYTAEGLLDAVVNGGRHIEIREHLDLTKVDPQQTDGKIGMLALSTKTWSITVRSLQWEDAGCTIVPKAKASWRIELNVENLTDCQ